MASDVTVVLHDAEIRAVLASEAFRRSAMGYGSRVVAIGRTTAPRRTGRGASSIHEEARQGGDGWEIRISWDAAHRYMRYAHSHAIQNAAYQVLGR